MEVAELPKDKKIILFDGVCNLCDASVQFVIKHDHRDTFRFVALQSALGQNIMSHIGLANQNIDSLVLYEPGKAYYYKTEAVVNILKELYWVFSVATLLLLFPTFITHKLYDYVAKNRYAWYGKKETCMIPTEEWQSKFLN